MQSSYKESNPVQQWMNSLQLVARSNTEYMEAFVPFSTSIVLEQNILEIGNVAMV